MWHCLAYCELWECSTLYHNSPIRVGGTSSIDNAHKPNQSISTYSAPDCGSNNFQYTTLPSDYTSSSIENAQTQPKHHYIVLRTARVTPWNLNMVQAIEIRNGSIYFFQKDYM